MTSDKRLPDIHVPGYPEDIALGNVSKDTGYPKVYVANQGYPENTVSVINGTTKATKDIPVAISPMRIVYNPTWDLFTPINAENLRKAHKKLESGNTIGKIVLSGF